MSRCVPGRADRPKTGKPVVLLKLTWGDQENVPLMLPLSAARRMVVELVLILKHFGDDLARQLAMLHFPGRDWPTVGMPHTRHRPTDRNRFEPSINPSTPHHPIEDRDVWQLIQMLRHVRSHDDFLLLIGAPILGIEGARKPRKRRRK
jgi:hypothetical protein